MNTNATVVYNLLKGLKDEFGVYPADWSSGVSDRDEHGRIALHFAARSGAPKARWQMSGQQ